MAQDTLKSTAITNLDATPPVRATAGAGGNGIVTSSYGYVTPTTGTLTGSTYRMLRLPSNASLKHLRCDTKGTITTMVVDVTLAYSDRTLDETGSSSGNSGIVNSLDTTASLFAHSLDLNAQTAGAVVDITNQNAAYPPSARNMPLWQAAGLSTDPGGFFDILMTHRSTLSVSGAQVGMEAEVVMPYV